MIFSYDGITFKITEALAFINDLITIVNTGSINELASTVCIFIASFAICFLVSKMPMQISTLSFILVNVLIDPFMRWNIEPPSML